MALPDYHCVLAPSGEWHLTHPQIVPPPLVQGGCFTLCGNGGWIDFKRGFERRRPTCTHCVRIVEEYEAKHAKPVERKPRSMSMAETFSASYAPRKPRSMPT